MPIETEIKINIDKLDIEDIRKRILKIRAELFKARHLEVDEYFDKRKYLENSNQLLRLRDNSTLCYKGPPEKKAKFKIREEIELLVGDGNRLKTILEKLGYKKTKQKEKYREAYIIGTVQIMIDETPIGNFIEIEGTKENVPVIAAKLGFAEKDFIKKTYSEIWKSYAKKHGKKGDMIFNDNQ